MKKLLLLVTIVLFLSFGCNKEEDVKSKDLWGMWHVTDINLGNGWYHVKEDFQLTYITIGFSKGGDYNQFGELGKITKDHTWKLKWDIIQIYFLKGELMKYEIKEFNKNNNTAYFIRTVGNSRIEIKAKKGGI
jgi:hypothetical protein